jgi:hypothetical protein
MAMGFFQYYWKVFSTAFVHSPDTAQTIIFFLIIAAGLLTYYVPAVKMTVDLSGWQVAAITFGLVVIARLILAPYWIWQEEHEARIKAETTSRTIEYRDKLVTKDRAKFVGPLQKFYASGAALQRVLLSKTVTDAEIDQADIDANKWLNEVAAWIQTNMGAAAVSRFINNSDKNSYSFSLPGTHTSEAREKRDNILNSFSGCLINLDTLMKSDHWDPQ